MEDLARGATSQALDCDAWADRFTVADAGRLLVLLSNSRCGTQLLKRSVTQFGDIGDSFEVFARHDLPSGSKGFNRFVQEVEGAGQAAILDPERAMRGYLAWYLDGQYHDHVLIDMKYAHLGRLGLDERTPPLPQIAVILAAWRVPVIHLMRTNPLQEAISALVAEQTGEYALLAGQATTAQTPPGVHLDPAKVAELAHARRAAHLAAAGLLRELGFRYQRVFTETIRGPGRVREILRVLHGFGIWCEPPAHLHEPLLDQNSVGRVTNLSQIIDHLRQHSPDLAAD